MNRAYASSSLNDAQDNLGQVIHFAVNECHYDLDEFVSGFSGTVIAYHFEHDRYVICEKTGIELFFDICEATGKHLKSKEPDDYTLDYSPEYWTGMILATYQWYSGLSFFTINQVIKASKIRDLFDPFHEADITKSLEYLDQIFLRDKKETYLQYYRENFLYSISDISRITKIPVEILKKCEIMSDKPLINSLSGNELHSLAKLFKCKIDDLLEYIPEPIRKDEFYYS